MRRGASYQIQARLGVGATGEVWSGVHRPTGAPVAIKILRARPAAATDVHSQLLEEARAAAMLDHPGVVQVYDHGIVSEAIQGPAPDGVGPHSPLLVMELVPGGSLQPLCGRLSWPEVLRVLRQLLDALGHAHARGVLHRDVKPANVLQRSGLARVKLTDFGIAWVGRGERPGERAAPSLGTPSFMAPEQFRGDWRDQGPWTDLYGLGCLAWSLLTGGPPFGSAGYVAAMQAHTRRPVPRLRARTPAPEGVEGWLCRLLEKDPAARFACAADARRALEEAATTPTREAETEDAPRSGPAGATLTATLGSTPRPPPPERVARTPRLAPALPPEDWRAPTEDGAPILPAPVGAALAGLRPPPLCGRLAERDALWAAWRAVALERRPGLVVLEGAEGVGRSRLAAWLAARVEELGVGVALPVPRELGEDERGALRRLILGWLRLEGIDPGERGRRVAAWLEERGVEDADERAALARLLDEGDAERGPGAMGAAGAALERDLTRRLLARLAEERPVVLVLEEESAVAIPLVSHLLRSPAAAGIPLLAVVTLDEEASGEVRASLEGSRRHPRARWLTLGPLVGDELSTLLRVGLGLGEQAAAAVAERSDGNPGRACQTVNLWVDCGVLVPTAGGLRLQEGSGGGSDPGALPVAGAELWASRLRAALAEVTEADWRSLELAAAFGPELSLADWSAAAASLGLAPARDALERLLDAGLASSRQGGLAFRAGVRAALLRRARDGGRSAAQHGAAADALRARGVRRGARLGELLLEAGRPAEAIAVLQDALRVLDGDSQREELARLLLRAVAEARPPLSDPARGAAMLLRGHLAHHQGSLDLSIAWFRRVSLWAERHGDLATGARAWRGIARSLGELGRTEEALRAADRSVALAERTADRAELWAARWHRALLLEAAGKLEEASMLWRALLDGAGPDADTLAYAEALRLAARVARKRGAPTEGLPLLHEARRRYQALGDRAGVAACENTLGGTYRELGELDAAVRHYEVARQMLLVHGVPVRAAVCDLNRGLILAQQGDPCAARAAVEAAEEAFARWGDHRMAAHAAVALLPLLVAQGDWPEAERRLATALEALPESTEAEPDTAQAATRAAWLARERGRQDLARGAATLAVRQWRRLGRAADDPVLRELEDVLVG